MTLCTVDGECKQVAGLFLKVRHPSRRNPLPTRWLRGFKGLLRYCVRRRYSPPTTCYTSKMPVPDEIDVYFDERKPPIKCRSLEEVDATLGKLHLEADPKKVPLAVAIKVFGHEIDTGLGTDPTFLCLQIEPCDGEYYLAVGEQMEGETRTFYGAGQDSYWQPKNLIPLEEARSAVRHFIEHQERSPSTRWQDWDGRDV